ncbi:MAG: cyclic nucleotide-binding domain-containing protein [Elusimicrobia bacterium]|nr:cyclic nucleotide-binding domain-containing protein [Elusimicrobiota bacterium]
MPLSRFLRRFFGDPATSRKRAFLRSLDLFKDLRFVDLGHLVQSMHSRTYHEGEVLFMEGDIGRALFILESGQVQLTKAGPDGQPRKIYTIQPGEFFGEMALLEQLPRTATATAVERSQVLLLYRSKLESLLSSHPRIGVQIMTHLAQLLSARLRRAGGSGSPAGAGRTDSPTAGASSGAAATPAS